MAYISEHHGNMAEHAEFMVVTLCSDEGCSPDQMHSMKQAIIEAGYPEDEVYQEDSTAVIRLMKIMKGCGINRMHGHALQHSVLANAMTDAYMKSIQALSE